MPLLSLGCHDLTVVDIRHFNGSLRTLIKDTRPDAVLVIYTNNWEGSINWNSHGDEFDFRWVSNAPIPLELADKYLHELKEIKGI